MYELIRAFLARGNDSRLQLVESLRSDSTFRRIMGIMSVAWSVGLLADAAVSIALVYVLPIKTYLVVNPRLGHAAIGSRSVWNLRSGARRRRRAGRARGRCVLAPGARFARCVSAEVAKPGKNLREPARRGQRADSVHIQRRIDLHEVDAFHFRMCGDDARSGKEVARGNSA